MRVTEETELTTSEANSMTNRAQDADWLTARDAGAYAGGIGVSTIREACNRNELRHIRIRGGAKGPIRTRREWVDEWLECWARGGEPV
jgi:hypothetical protein